MSPVSLWLLDHFWLLTALVGALWFFVWKNRKNRARAKLEEDANRAMAAGGHSRTSRGTHRMGM